MSEGDPERKLAELERKLAAHRAKDTRQKAHQEEHYSQAQVAWRMVTEMVAGLGIGFGIGYGLDILLGSSPWLMVLFTLLGFAAGVNVMMRTARDIQAGHPAETDGNGTGARRPDDER